VQITKNSPFFSRVDVALLLLIFLALAGLYYPVAIKLTKVWLMNDNYSHGFFIPFVSLYMVYTLRKELRQLPVEPTNLGIVFLAIGLCQLVFATMGSEFFLKRISFIPLLFGIILFLFGTKYARKLAVPVLYLLFMIPLPTIIWNKIAFPMQLFSTKLTAMVIQLLGIPVLREGNILHLMDTTLEVVDACSGLRSLTTIFALSAAIIWFTHCSTVKKWVFFFMAAPIAVAANIIRLVFTAVLASYYGPEMAEGFLHEFSGIVTFLLGMVMLMVLKKVLVK